MKTLALSLALIVAASLAFVAVPTCQPAPPVSLKPGDKAPGLKLKASDGKEYDLAQFRGVKAVAICWFPRAGSQGAKNQCAALEAAMPQIPRDKLQVFGCSTAALDVTTAFAQQGNYSFPVLSDADRTAATAWGCLKAGGLSERWTFLIDDKGVILAVNKSITPQTQGADLTKMLADAGLIPPVAPAAATTLAPQLKPGSTFSVQFSEMPPTFYDVFEGKTVPAQMTVYLPTDYDPGRKYPLFIFLGGWDGGAGTDLGTARGLTEGKGFICVSMPLFKATSFKVDKPNVAGAGFIMVEEDGRYMWPFFRTMLTKLDELIPNIDPAHRILGGFSNGAHATSALLDGSDGEIARRFSAYLLVEGGGKLQHYELLKDKPLLMVSSSAKSRPRAQQIAGVAKAAGARATMLCEDVGKHDFPVSSFPAVREWLRGPGLQ